MYAHLLDFVPPIKRQDLFGQMSAHNMCPTCGTEGDEGLDMFAYKCQLILGQRQPPHNVLNEVVWRHCCQVPLQLPQHHQFPFLERERHRERAWGDGEQREMTENEKAGAGFSDTNTL